MKSAAQYFYRHCRSGHVVFSRDAPPTQAKCEKCGEGMVGKCPHCQTELEGVLRGTVLIDRATGTPIGGRYSRPDHCKNCGEPFAWANTTRRLDAFNLWSVLHPKVIEFAKPRIEAGHYADAVEAVFKELNAIVKSMYLQITGDELDGVSLMRKAFSPNKPVIVLDDLGTETGRSVQQGYLDLFAGSMAGIRNPKAHGNINITKERAAHHLVLASLLFHRLDERR
ncbi:MAG: TIGR02391 family protein [Burkholderiales bacterium]|nr:TIGR02391 family protein [Burkholderiales bacterium]